MNVLNRFLVDNRRPFVKWSIGMAGVVAISALLYPSVRDQPGFEETVESLPPAVKALAGLQSGVSILSAPGYLHSRIFSTMFPLILLLFAVAVGARAVGGSEEDGTLELVCAHPVTRLRVAVERYVGVVAAVAGLAGIGGLVLLALAPTVGLLEGVSVVRLLAAVTGAFGLGVLHAGIAFAAGCAAGRRGTAVAVAASVAVGGYLLHGLVTTVDLLEPLRFVSPWWWYLERNVLVSGPTLMGTLLPVALSPAVAAAGGSIFLRRDLRS